MKLCVLLLANSLLYSSQSFAQTPAPARPAAPRPARPAAPAASGMTNQNVIDMVAAGIADDVILTAIRQATNRNFTLNPDGLIALKRGKVPDAIIRVMQSGAETTNTIVPPPTSRPAAAPAAAPAPAPVAAAPPKPTTVNIKVVDGTTFNVRSSKGLSAKTLKTGDVVTFEVVNDVSVDGSVVVPKGSVASGKVTQATPQSFRRFASLEFRIESVKAVNGDDLQVRAAGSADPSGLVTTKRGEVPAGTEFVISVKGDAAISVPVGGGSAPNPDAGREAPVQRS